MPMERRTVSLDGGETMIRTVRGVVREGKIELLDAVDLHEGARLLVMVVPDEDDAFWSRVSEPALDAVWDNAEDDIYARLLEK